MMSETANSEAGKRDAEKPADDGTRFPPFPAPKDEDFDEECSEEEKKFYMEKFPDINMVRTMRLHCTACDRHLGSAARHESKMRAHPMLRTLMCHSCFSFYNSGEFDKGDDGSELYCRWCGQGGQVYCCSNCPVVFCAKCIKRNLGLPKIKEIESTDDWKCFKCNPQCIWFLRATCWALLRYCDLKNKILNNTQDPDLKEAHKKDCALDQTECCKTRNRKKIEKTIKKENDSITKKAIPPSALPKLPPTIQVKKFASINLDESAKEPVKKAQKRPLSPKSKIILKNPITVSPAAKIMAPVSGPHMPKKIRMGNPQMLTPIRFPAHRAPPPPYQSFARIRPKPPNNPLILNNQFNGYNNTGMYHNVNTGMYNPDIAVNDNINLSLESLTQGLDMNAMSMASRPPPMNSDVICTPDFPLEPLCEVTEENNDDDVQCMTPGPAFPKNNNPPPLITKFGTALSEITSDNIIQMTENDVTVNQATGGLKFRVDPQTLSSNKMYRLPDGRIFAINANPNMPGGYSATIVAVTDTASGKITPKGGTYAAKLSAVSSPRIGVSPLPIKANTSENNQNNSNSRPNNQNSSNPRPSNQNSSNSRQNNQNSSNSRPNVRDYNTKEKKAESTSTPRQCDLKVPVEWYRYNLIDAVDALEYSLSKLQKLKKEATSVFLRTRTVAEMRTLHKKLERLLSTSTTRFNEIKGSLNKEMKQYLQKKMNTSSNQISDEDDDVEILNDMDEDPIFIDENSLDSEINDITGKGTPEVDLTGATSENNDSGEKSIDQSSSRLKALLDETNTPDLNTAEDSNGSGKNADAENDDDVEMSANVNVDDNVNMDAIDHTDDDQDQNESCKKSLLNSDKTVTNSTENENENIRDSSNKNIPSNDVIETKTSTEKDETNENEDKREDKKDDVYENDDKSENRKEDTGVNKNKNEIDDADVNKHKSENENDDMDVEDKNQDENDKIDGNEDKSENEQNEIDINEDKTQDVNVNEDKSGDVDINKDKSQDIDINEGKTQDVYINEDKSQDVEMSEELIETLLKDDNAAEATGNEQNMSCNDISEDFQEP